MTMIIKMTQMYYLKSIDLGEFHLLILLLVNDKMNISLSLGQVNEI